MSTLVKKVRSPAAGVEDAILDCKPNAYSRGSSCASTSMSRRTVSLAVLALSISIGCINYSSYQDARIVEKGHSSGTIAVSASQYDSDFNDDDSHWFVAEGNPRWGLGARLDAGFKMSVLLTEESLGWVTIGADLRFGIIRNYLAATVPVSFAVGSYIFSSTNLQPGVILTLPVGDDVDINGSVRRSFYLDQDLQPYGWWLYNAGLGIVVAPGWRLRPEVGWMVSDSPQEDEPTYMQFGLGISREH